jgi:hypothetical protein
MELNDNDVMAALAAPFDPSEFSLKPGRGSRGEFRYLSLSSVKRRLDSVLGMAGWESDVFPSTEGVKATITIYLPSGRALTRSALGGYPADWDDMSDEDKFKGGDTDAFKRAATRFGVDVYGAEGAPAKNGAPEPRSSAPTSPHAPRSDQRQMSFDNFSSYPPPGKAVFAWAKQLEAHYHTTLIHGMDEKAKLYGFPYKFTEWTQEQINRICDEVVDYLQGLETYKGEFDKLKPRNAASQLTGADLPDADIKPLKKDIIKNVRHLIFLNTGTEATDKQVGLEIKARLASGGHKDTTLSELKDKDFLTRMYATLASDIDKAATPQAVDDIPF